MPNARVAVHAARRKLDVFRGNFVRLALDGETIALRGVAQHAGISSRAWPGMLGEGHRSCDAPSGASLPRRKLAESVADSRLPQTPARPTPLTGMVLMIPDEPLILPWQGS